MSTTRYSETKAPVTEVADKTTIERAIYDARWDFKGILGQGHYTERNRSLYQLRGTEVNRARRILDQAVYEDEIRYGDVPITYVKKLGESATRALVAVKGVQITDTNAERLDNVITRLEQVVTYTGKALDDTETTKAVKAAEEFTRWPEDKDRAAEIQQWASCLTAGLNLMQNLGVTEEEYEIWDWTPEDLATHLSTIREEEANEQYRDELGEIVAALDDGNITGAWMTMYDFARERKGAEA